MSHFKRTRHPFSKILANGAMQSCGLTGHFRQIGHQQLVEEAELLPDDACRAGGKLLTLLLFYVYHLVHSVHKGGYLDRNIVRRFYPAYWQYFPKRYFP